MARQSDTTLLFPAIDPEDVETTTTVSVTLARMHDGSINFAVSTVENSVLEQDLILAAAMLTASACRNAQAGFEATLESIQELAMGKIRRA